LRGARVLLADVESQRLRIAEDCGIRDVVNPSLGALNEAISSCFGERGADIIINCAGTKESLGQALDCSRPASRIVIVGNFKEPVEIEMPRLQRREVDIISVMMHLSDDFRQAIELIYSNAIDVDSLITHHYAISEFVDAYKYIDSGSRDIMKIMMVFDTLS
jgi:L-iditol 2-dehydrogenase